MVIRTRARWARCRHTLPTYAGAVAGVCAGGREDQIADFATMCLVVLSGPAGVPVARAAHVLVAMRRAMPPLTKGEPALA